MNETTITDINIPFGRMVAIILKWMFASIPAILLMYLIMGIFALIMMALFGSAIYGLSGFGDDFLETKKDTPALEERNESIEEAPANF